MKKKLNKRRAQAILSRFLPGARLLFLAPCGKGLINHTWFLTATCPGEKIPRALVLQRLNTDVFSDYDGVMANIAAVTAHLTKKHLPTMHFYPVAKDAANTGAAKVRPAEAGSAEAGSAKATSAEAGSAKAASAEAGSAKTGSVEAGSVEADPASAAGACQAPLYLAVTPEEEKESGFLSGVWRLSDRLSGESRDAITPELFCRAGQAFGAFQAGLADFDASVLVETIPAFHDTPARLAALKQAADADPFDRLKNCRAEVDGVLAEADFASLLTDALSSGTIPLRVVHNDTKINNIVFAPDAAHDTVIDLDTVMPGTLLYDVGDALRSGAALLSEGAENYDENGIDPVYCTAFLRGFLPAIGSHLTPAEKKLIPESAAILALELGCRFLTDYLLGDVYFKTTAPGENLRRARGQLVLFARIREKKEELLDLIWGL